MKNNQIYELHQTPEFEKWLESEPLKSRGQIEERLLRLSYDGHFGICKSLEGIWELKWANGRRVYYAYLSESNILLLLGGNKNGQSKDIIRRKKSLKSMQKKFRLKKGIKLTKHNPFKTLLDEKLIAQAFWECLKDNDPEGAMEVISAHLNALNKVHLAEEAEIPRSTLYHTLRRKNPTLKTVAKLVHSSI